MKQLTQYIQEKLHISKYKKEKTRYLSNKDLPQEFWDNFTTRTSDDLNQFERDIKDKLYDINTLLKNIKYKEQLFAYWFEAVQIGWVEAYDVFRKEIINKKYATEDEIDAASIELFDLCSDDNEKQNCLNYMKKYNIEIKK